MPIMLRKPARQGPAGGRTEWAALVITGVLAVVLWLILGGWWPWALALGILLVAALIGVRRPGALATGLAAADIWWLLSIPLWGWALTIGGIALIVGLWWSWAYRKTRSTPRVAPNQLPAVRGAQRVPPESPTEITAPIPIVFPRPPAAGPTRLPIPGLAGRPVVRWQPITALAVAAVLLTFGVIGWRLDAAATAEREQAAQQALHEQSLAKLLPRTGVDLVWAIARAISTRDPRTVCFAFTPPASRAFAQAQGADTCEAAIMNLANQIPDGRAYENAVKVLPLGSGSIINESPTRMIVNACAVNVRPPSAGPNKLGIFTMDTQYGEGSPVTGYATC